MGAMRAKLLKIDIEAGAAGLWHASSPDMPNFHMTETSREILVQQISLGLEELIEGTSAYPVEWKATDDLYWVVVPARELSPTKQAP